MGPVRVFLVDDSEDMRLLCRIVLDKDPAFTVWGEATNGEEAVAAVEHDGPDVIVLDVMMPVMDGLTALPLLRARCPWVPIVLLTASASDETREHGLSLGAWAVLDKQIGLEELRAALLDAAASEHRGDRGRRAS